MDKIKIISVDFQKEFTTQEGNWFNPGKSVNFIKDTIIPFLLKIRLRYRK